ncbi:hypothetical protein AA102526_1986 [Asaia lannensis NBRC 102526]|nr:hypothetical protein AA102526_1986 [Asaia lannensis NBRC 102526]
MQEHDRRVSRWLGRKAFDNVQQHDREILSGREPAGARIKATGILGFSVAWDKSARQ